MAEEITKIVVGGTALYVQMSFDEAQSFVAAGGPGFVNTVDGGRAWVNRDVVAAVVAEPAKARSGAAHFA
jgi:hypothetical protein